MKNEKQKEGLCPESQTLFGLLKYVQVLDNNVSIEQVLEIIQSGEPIFIFKDVPEEVTVLTQKAVSRALKCKDYITKGRTDSCVRTYFKILFASEEGDLAVERMRNKQTRPQFMCEQMGRMMELGYFYAKTADIAKSLGYISLQIDSVCRYIRRGKNIQKKILEK